MKVCPNCRQENPPIAKFCLACATLLPEAAPAREQRKTVTIVFSDVSGSTKLGEHLDPESLRRVMSRYFDVMRQVLERHGGTVEKFIGDAVMAVFGIPYLHEDDALRAVRAAAEIREELRELNSDLEKQWGVSVQFRTGVNTGEVVAGDPASGQTLVTGDAVNVAARLEQAAPPGEILIGAPTYRLVRDAVTVEELDPLSLKGKTDGVPAFRLTSVIEGASGLSRNLDAPMVGRESEQALLAQTFDRAVRDRACQLFTVMGPAGAGKSRLVAEFLKSVRDRATVLEGRCLPYGEGITFWPVREIVKAAVGSTDADKPDDTATRIRSLLGDEANADIITERIAGAIGVGDSGGAIEETFWAIRKLLEKLAHAQPLVVVFDDIHWADSTFLDLIEHIADWSRDASILLLCPARPELLDNRPGWGGGKLNATSILLEPLSQEESEQLLAGLLGDVGLSREVEARISEGAEGNPLFVEEMLRMMIDDGLLQRRDGHWEAMTDLSTVPVPPTINALLTARLDRLQGEERQVVERASIGGKVFYRGAVTELSPPAARPEVGKHLMTLVRRELVRSERSTFRGEDAFHFRHLLIRDAAYESMPKEMRADLHEVFAEWLERMAGEAMTEYEEIIAYHFEQAYRYRRELGPVDEAAQTLARRAFNLLQVSSKRAHQRGDMSAAVNLLSRAAELISHDDPDRLRLLVDLGDALNMSGKAPEAMRVLTEAIEGGKRSGDTRVVAHGRLLLLEARLGFAEDDWQQEARDTIAELMSQLESQADHAGMARAWRLLNRVYAMDAHWTTAVEAAERMLAEGRLAGDRFLESMGAVDVVDSLHGGPTPVNTMKARTEAIAQGFAGNRMIEATSLGALGLYAAMQGDFEQGRAQVHQCLAILSDLGQAIRVFSEEGFSLAAVEELADDTIAEEAHLRHSHDALELMGEHGFRSSIAGLLAHTLYRLGRDDEALHFANVCRAAAASQDALSQALWRTAEGKVLARRGRQEEAEAFVAEAIEVLRVTDMIDFQARAYADLGEVLLHGGKREEALEAARQALDLFEQKGNLVMAERTRKWMDEVQVV